MVIVPACLVVVVVFRVFVRALYTCVPVMGPSGDEPAIAYVALRSCLSMLSRVPVKLPPCESEVYQLRKGEKRSSLRKLVTRKGPELSKWFKRLRALDVGTYLVPSCW